MVYGGKEDTEDVDDIEAMEETKDVEDIEGTKGTEDMEDMADMEGTARSSTAWPSAQEPVAGTSGVAERAAAEWPVPAATEGEAGDDNGRCQGEAGGGGG